MENIRKIIKQKISNLENSKYTFESLYKIIHDNENRIFCEYIDNYKIKYITYNECDKYCKQTAEYLNKTVTDKKHSYIGIMMDNSLEWITSFWGLLMCGYKPLLLNDRLPESLLIDVCNRLEVNTILISNKTKKASLKAKKIVINFNDLKDYKELKKSEWENEIALTTTATSLNIKICIYTGKEFTYQVLNSKSIVKKNSMIKEHYNGSLKLLTFLPFYHIFGLVATYFWFSIFGRTFVFLNNYAPDTILNTVKRHKVTHIFAVPMLWHTVYNEIVKEINRKDEKTKKKFSKGIELSIKLQTIMPRLGKKIASQLFREVQNATFGDSIKFMISGGGYINKNALKTINAIGYPLYVGYGMSEIGITSVELRKKAKYRVLGSIGKPFDSVEYLIEDNILKVRGKSICSKIITPDKKILINHEEFFTTNDIAIQDKNKSYYIEGRKDDVFIDENGEKINPDYIESNINFKNINSYSILEYDKKLTLIVKIDKNTNEVIIKKILLEIDELLKKVSLIKKVYFTYEELVPPTAIKVSRTLLLKNISDKKVNLLPLDNFNKIKNKSFSEYENDIKETVRETIANILNIPDNKVKDNSHFIFDLGGTSLTYLSLLVELEKIYDIKFNFTDKSCSTLQEFSEYISNEIKNN